MSMKTIICICFLLLAFSPSFADRSKQGTCKSIADIELTCRSATDGLPESEYEFCVEALISHPAARSTDLHGLALAATRLAIDHASSTESKIEELMELEDEAHIKDNFISCLEVYSEATDRLRDALDNMSSRLYPQAMGLLSSAMNAHGHCERVFGKMEGTASPLVKEDRNYGRLADIAMAIAASVE